MYRQWKGSQRLEAQSRRTGPSRLVGRYFRLGITQRHRGSQEGSSKMYRAPMEQLESSADAILQDWRVGRENRVVLIYSGSLQYRKLCLLVGCLDLPFAMSCSSACCSTVRVFDFALLCPLVNFILSSRDQLCSSAASPAYAEYVRRLLRQCSFLFPFVRRRKVTLSNGLDPQTRVSITVLCG